MIETLGTHEALELALTAAAGDVATGGLMFARRVLRLREPQAPADPRIEELRRMSWGVFSQMLFWAFEQLGYDVEMAQGGGMVDFMLLEGKAGKGYTYVQARRWQEAVISSDDIADLRRAMELVDVERGIWMSLGQFTERARRLAEKSKITLVGPDELIVIIDRIRATMKAAG